MYKFYYGEVLEDHPREARSHERTALDRSVEMMTHAETKGTQSIEAVQALHFVRRLWGIFIEDLARSDNGLPQKLRADLVSVGIWVMREAEDIRQARTRSFKALIDVSKTISEGLR